MTSRTDELAINGGPKTRTVPWPGRGHLGAEEKAAVDALFERSIATGDAFGYSGPEEEALCKEFAEWMGGGYADGVNSGTAAVFVALHALNPEPYTEIIVSSITDAGGMMPVVLLNCIPMVADTAPGSYNCGPAQIEEMISPRTSAILVSHIGGEPADVRGIAEVARKHGIPLVEDCSQSPGATLDGVPVGRYGDVAAFSLMFGKHVCAGGQGGAVFTTNEELSWRVKRVSDRGKPFGLPTGSTNDVASLNLNMDELSAAIARAQLTKLPGIVAGRRAVVRELSKAIGDMRSVSIPEVIPRGEHSYWYWRLRVNSEAITCDKDIFCGAIQAEGLPVSPSYRFAMPHMMDWFKSKSVFGSSRLPWSSPEYTGDPEREFPCPNAMAVTSTDFNLHLHESWGPQEISDAVAALRKVERAFLK